MRIVSRLACLIIGLLLAVAPVGIVRALENTEIEKLTSGKISIPFPDTFKKWPEKVVVNQSEERGNGEMVTGTGRKTFTYRVEVWGTVLAEVSDFKARVAETLADARGWVRAGLSFHEVSGSADLVIALSDAAHLDATPGCSGELSCTTWSNQVIINDLRWRGGTTASNAAGMSQRDYQHMVVNHEVGHWLGHYAHVESCPNGGPAPIMLQQSTGLRGCDSFNAWPLDSELWTNK